MHRQCCWGDMSDRSRSLPIVGGLIAVAAAMYATRRGTPSAMAERSSVPARPTAPGWGRSLANVWNEMDRDHVSVMAAGVAFYSFLSIFPAMSAVISVFGLVADPAIIERQLAQLSGVMPAAALELLSSQLHSLISASQGKLGISLLISLALTFWSAMSGMATLMQALTVAYEEAETRGVLGFYGQVAALTLAVGAFAVLSLLLIAVAPALIDWVPLPQHWRDRLGVIRWPLLVWLAFLALAFVYRFGPARRHPAWDWFSPGTVAAAILWLLGSAGFSLYVTEFAAYDRTYGSLGAVVVLMMWLYVSAYIVLAGAELNAEAERAGRLKRLALAASAAPAVAGSAGDARVRGSFPKQPLV